MEDIYNRKYKADQTYCVVADISKSTYNEFKYFEINYLNIIILFWNSFILIIYIIVAVDTLLHLQTTEICMRYHSKDFWTAVWCSIVAFPLKHAFGEKLQLI